MHEPLVSDKNANTSLSISGSDTKSAPGPFSNPSTPIGSNLFTRNQQLAELCDESLTGSLGCIQLSQPGWVTVNVLYIVFAFAWTFFQGYNAVAARTVYFDGCHLDTAVPNTNSSIPWPFYQPGYVNCVQCNGQSGHALFSPQKSDTAGPMMLLVTIGGGVVVIGLEIFALTLFAQQRRTFTLLSYGVYTSKLREQNAKFLVVVLVLLFAASVYQFFLLVGTNDMTDFSILCDGGVSIYGGFTIFLDFDNNNPTAVNIKGWVLVLKTIAFGFLPFVPIAVKFYGLCAEQFLPLNFKLFTKQNRGGRSSVVLSHLKWQVNAQDLVNAISAFWKAQPQDVKKAVVFFARDEPSFFTTHFGQSDAAICQVLGDLERKGLVRPLVREAGSTA